MLELTVAIRYFD